MSIYDEIKEMVKDGRMHFLSPAFTGYTKRQMYVSPEVKRLLVGPWEDETVELQGNAVRGLLDRYLEGRTLTISGDKDTNVNLKRLMPPQDEIWEFRMVNQRPAARVFGSFIGKDMFVALTCATRIDLGEFNSEEWKLALQQYKHQWQRLFHAYAPISGDNFDAYLSRNLLL